MDIVRRKLMSVHSLYILHLGLKGLKELRHEDIAVLGQFCAIIITLIVPLPIHKMLL